MCFSATGSFAAATVLGAVGARSLALAVPNSSRMLAAMPLLFASQQAAEGVVWLTLASPRSLPHVGAMHVFLAFALLVWPTWVPAAMEAIESTPERRGALNKLKWLGVAVSGLAAAMLLRWRPEAHLASHSIAYAFGPADTAAPRAAYLALYLVPTCVPFFVSSMAMAKTIGASMVAALIMTLAFRDGAVTSVWCFFAALLSVLIGVALTKERRLAAVAGRAAPPIREATAPPR